MDEETQPEDLSDDTVEVVVVLNGCMVGGDFRETGDIVEIEASEADAIEALGAPARIKRVEKARRGRPAKK